MTVMAGIACICVALAIVSFFAVKRAIKMSETAERYRKQMEFDADCRMAIREAQVKANEKIEEMYNGDAVANALNVLSKR